MIIIVSKIICSSEDLMDKHFYTYDKAAQEKAFEKFKKEVRDILIDLASYDLEDEIPDPYEVSNERIIELLVENGDDITYSVDDYFGYIKSDGTQEIEIDLETYLPVCR